MSTDKKSIKKKAETAILAVSAILTFSFIIWTVCTWLNYLSVKIDREIDEAEYAEICVEYRLDPQNADIEYAFSAGRDLRGVRLLLSESDLEDMNAVFSERVFDNEYSDYFKLKESGMSFANKKRSDGVEREAVCPKFAKAINMACYVFESDGKYYMEIEKCL